MSERLPPLDDIESVWADEDGTWCLRVSGWFENWIDIQNRRTTTYISVSRTSP